MIYKEYGQKNEKVMFFLHGGGLSWWSYEEVAEKLSEKYRVILPVLDGHGDSDRPFISIKDNAADIIRFIEEKFDGHIFLLGGLSLGAQIALEILSLKSDICDYAVIESALVIPSEITAKLIKPMMDGSYWLIKKHWFSRLQFRYLKIRPDLYDKYYEDSIKISKENMISFLKANSLYSVDSNLYKTNAKVLIISGEKEQKSIIKSSDIIKKRIPGSCRIEVPGLYHGQLSMNNSEKYILFINDLIK